MESQSYEHIFPHAGDDGIVDCEFFRCFVATTSGKSLRKTYKLHFCEWETAVTIKMSLFSLLFKFQAQYSNS